MLNIVRKWADACRTRLDPTPQHSAMKARVARTHDLVRVKSVGGRQRFRPAASALRQMTVSLLLGLSSAIASAANVDLTVSKSAPGGAAQYVPFTYTVTVGNFGAATATNSVVTDQLPAGLSGLTAVSSTGTPGASCPTLPQFTAALAARPVPTTAGSPFSLTIPLLPVGETCTLSLSVNPLNAGSLVNVAVVAPGPGDTDTNSVSNTASTTTTITATLISPTVVKTVTSSSVSSYPATIQYRVVITGDPTINMPSTIQASIRDNAGPTGGVVTWRGASTWTATTPTCVSSMPNLCPTNLSGGSGGLGFFVPIGGTFTNGLPAGATITLDYTLTVTEPSVCGAPNLANSFQFRGAGLTNLGPSANAPGVLLPKGQGRDCAVLTLPFSATKIPTGNPKVTAEGGTARYQLTFSTGAAIAPNTYGSGVPFGLTDSLANTPSSSSILERAVVVSCTATGGANSGSGLCPANLSAGQVLKSAAPMADSFGNNNILNENVTFTGPGAITLEYELTYTNTTSPSCLPSVIAQFNSNRMNFPGSGAVLPAGFDDFRPTFSIGRVGPGYPVVGFGSVGYVELDFDVPKCVDIAVNKTISPPSPSVGLPLTFTLDYTNNTSAVTGAATTATNVPITDVLGTHFTPQAVSCFTLSGTATPPTVTLGGNITGTNPTFAALIPSISNGAVVRCTISGVVNSTGTYTNALPPPTNPWNGSGRDANLDLNLGNNTPAAGYGVAAPGNLQITKLLGTNSAGYVAGTTFPVSASCTVTPIPASTPIIIVSGPVNLLPNVPQTLPVPPSTANQTVSCVLSEGAPSSAAAATYSYVVPPVFNPANATISPTPASNASVSVTVTNNLSQVPVGSLTVTKNILGGPPAGYSGLFTFAADCGAAGTFTTSVTLVGGTSGTSAALINIPTPATCNVSEALSGNPSTPTGAPPPSGYAWGAAPVAQSISVTTGNVANVVVSNTLVALTGSLTVSKTITGAPGGYTPSGPFSVFATCSLPAAGSRYPAAGFVSVTTTVPGVISDIPAGATCTVTEDTASRPAAAANYNWSAPTYTQPATAIVAGSTVTASVDNAMTANPGTLTVTKTITPASPSVTGAFPFTVACATPTATYNGSVNVTAGNTGTTTVSILAGSTACAITETVASRPAAPAGYAWAAPTYTQPAATAMAAGGTATGAITNALQSGSVVINKTVTLAVPQATTLSFTLTCTAPVTTPATTALGTSVSTTQTITLAAGATTGSVTASPIAAGSTCSVTETAPTAIAGYQWGTTPAAVTGLAIANAANATAAFTNDLRALVTVSGRVYREASVPANTVDNGNSVDPGLVTAISISCTNPVFTANTTSAADGTYSLPNVPSGATCTITETQPVGYTNAYNTRGAGATGDTGGTPGSTGDSTITLIVPTAAAGGYDFAEQSADTISTVVCTPSSAAAGTPISCTLTCTNNGPGTAVGAACRFTGTVPPGAVNSCATPATSASLAVGASLSCTLNYVAPSSSTRITGGAGADNDINGGTVSTAGNNPAAQDVQWIADIPTLSGMAALLLTALLAMFGLIQRRRHDK